MTALVADARVTLLPNRRMAAGTAASVLAHAGLIASLFLLTPLKQLVVPPPRPVSVEIVTQAQFAAIATPAPVAATPGPQSDSPAEEGGTAGDAKATPVPAPSSAPPAPSSPDHIATEFYASGILKEPGMAHIRRTFETIAPSEQLVQLCNIEGLEQIRRAAPETYPDTLVPYAMADTLAAGLTLSAPGGAFRSRRRWFGVAFTCTVAADLRSVTAFEFKLGDPIPPEVWEEHNLNAEDSEE